MLFRLWFPHVLPSSFIIVIIMFIIFVLLSFSLLLLSFSLLLSLVLPPLSVVLFSTSSFLVCLLLPLLLSVFIFFMPLLSLRISYCSLVFPFFSILYTLFFLLHLLSVSTTIWHLHQFCKNGQKLSIFRSCFALKSSWVNVNFTLTLWMVIFADTCTQHCLFLPYLWVAHPWHFMHWQLSTLLCRDLNLWAAKAPTGAERSKIQVTKSS